MKKILLVFAFTFFLSFPLRVHASGIIGGAMTSGILGAIFAQDAAEYALEAVYYAKDIIEAVEAQ